MEEGQATCAICGKIVTPPELPARIGAKAEDGSQWTGGMGDAGEIVRGISAMCAECLDRAGCTLRNLGVAR